MKKLKVNESAKAKNTMNVHKVYHTWTDSKGNPHTDKRHVVATVMTLKNGTKRITQNGATWYIGKDGTVLSNVEATIILGKWKDGKWRVMFRMDSVFSDILNILREGDTDLTGTLEDGSNLGVFCECAEGYADSEPLDDIQAAKVRDYFTPEFLTEEE